MIQQMPLAPALLPNISSVRLRAKALAMAEAILSPDWEDRYFSFNARWDDGEEMASMRNGQGDDWFLLLGSFGAAFKGFAHETVLARDIAFATAVQSHVPATFSSFLSEPAFGMQRASFCYWRAAHDQAWQKVDLLGRDVDSDDGSDSMLALLIEPASSYAEFVKWYYEVDVPLNSIDRIFSHSPLTHDLVASLNPDLSLAEANVFSEEIGYPAH